MATPNTYYNLRYLGHSVISKFIPGLGILQKPLHDIYVTYLTPKGPAMPAVSRLALTDRGILLTANGRDSFYSMRDILLWEPVQWVYVQTQDRKIMSAFEPLNPDHHLSQEGLFSKLDGQYRYLAQMKHEPILAMALKKSSDSKQIEVHAFVCVSDDQAFEVSQALWRAEQVFIEQEAKGIGVGCANCSPLQVTQEAPRSVRSPSYSGGVLQLQGPSGDPSSVSSKRGKQSARQSRGRKVDGEITLEELMRLADQATDTGGGGGGGWGTAVVAQEPPPPFRMGESWEVKQRNGVQRSRTFNEGQTSNNNEEFIGGGGPAPQHHRTLGEGGVGGGGGANGGQSHQAPCYENLAPLQHRTSENVLKNSTPPRSALQQPEAAAPGGHQRHLAVPADGGAQANQRQKKNPAPPASLRAVIADSKLSAAAAAASKRPSVLPGTEFSNAVNHLAVAVVSQGNPGDDDDGDDDGESLQQQNQSKPVALVQPRKVPRYKVLPDAAPESAAFLRKAGQKDDHLLLGAAREQAGGRSHSLSVYENDGVGQKALTPQPRRRTRDHLLPDADGGPSPMQRMTGSDLNLAAARRKSSLVVPDSDPVKKLSVPEQGSGGGDRKKQQLEKEEGERETMSADFDRNMVNAMLTHGTNFESALGYFP